MCHHHCHSQDLKPILDFFTTLIWQIIVIGTLFYFRGHLKDLISRIKHLKYPGGEADFVQSQEPNPPTYAVKIPENVKEVMDSAFFSLDGIKTLIMDSGLLASGEKITGEILIYQTKKQHTWLVSTGKNIFCVLDDENTRRKQRLIQWSCSLAEATPVVARPYKEKIGQLDIGIQHKGWLYSIRLHPNAVKFEEDIRNLISRT